MNKEKEGKDNNKNAPIEKTMNDKKVEKSERKKQKKSERENKIKKRFGKFLSTKQTHKNETNGQAQPHSHPHSHPHPPQKQQLTSLSLSSSHNHSKHHQIIEGVKWAWNRKRTTVSTQLGKDFPRFANKILFGPTLPSSSSSPSSLFTLLQNDPPLSHVFIDSLLPSGFTVPSPSLYLSFSNLEKQKFPFPSFFLLFFYLFS